MPKGKKQCPQCESFCGVRTTVCKECKYEFSSKQERQGGTKQTNHPLGQKYVPVPGLWVFDIPRGMNPVHAPEPMPSGPMTNQQIYDHVAYNGLGDCIYEFIPRRKIADPVLRKKWEKAKKAMMEAYDYLMGEKNKGGKDNESSDV